MDSIDLCFSLPVYRTIVKYIISQTIDINVKIIHGTINKCLCYNRIK